MGLHYLGYSSNTYEDYIRDLKINTLEGGLYAEKGDYIIKGVKGEFYPCKPDIFEMTYEPVELPNTSQVESVNTHEIQARSCDNCKYSNEPCKPSDELRVECITSGYADWQPKNNKEDL